MSVFVSDKGSFISKIKGKKKNVYYNYHSLGGSYGSAAVTTGNVQIFNVIPLSW
jgi:hypothetical protein